MVNVDAVYEYARATFDRVMARLDGRTEVERQALRQEAYRCNARARSAIGQVVILSGEEVLRTTLEEARVRVGHLNSAHDQTDLRKRQDNVYRVLTDALDLARSDLSA